MISGELMSVQELAEIVGRKVVLKQCGPTTWRGLCPVHDDRHPSFYVYLGRRGEGRYHCQVCGRDVDGDGADWLRKFEGKAVCVKPDPKFKREALERRARENTIRKFRDRNPDSDAPDWIL